MVIEFQSWSVLLECLEYCFLKLFIYAGILLELQVKIDFH
jgi:hypothetical protein